MPIPWKLIIRLALYLGAAAVIYGAIHKGVMYVENLGYQRRWGEDFVKEMRDDYSQAKLSDDARWNTVIANTREVLAGISRDLALMGNSLDAAALTAGLADRVWGLEHQFQGGTVPECGSGDDTAQRSKRSAEGLERLRQLEQRVLDTAGQCGAQEAALELNPPCECATHGPSPGH